MIFTRRGMRWMVDDRGFLRIPIEDDNGERWILYGWHDLI
jgi:hypothetical protein